MAISKIKMPDGIVHNIGVDWNNINDKPNIPTKTSDLTNDSNFLTQHQDISGKANKATTLSGYGITDAQPLINNNNTISSDFINDTSANNKFVTTIEKSTWNNKYDKPANGIPKTDLAQDIQIVLNRTIDSSFIEDSSNPVESQVIQDALNGKIDYITVPYNKIDNCIRSDTLYRIYGIPSENNEEDVNMSNSGFLFAISHTGNGDNSEVLCTQYLFKDNGEIRLRHKMKQAPDANPEDYPWTYFDYVNRPIDGALNEFSGNLLTNSTITSEFNQRIKRVWDDWATINDVNEYTDATTLYWLKHPQLGSPATPASPEVPVYGNMMFIPGGESYEDENAQLKYPFSSQIMITTEGKMYIRKADANGNFSSIEELKPEPEHGTIISDNKGWYTEENGVTKYLTGTYRLIDDMCILTGRAQIPYNWEELYYTLPITPTQGAATVSFDGGVHYYIGTTMRSSETVTNASVMRIARVDGERFSADTTIHFVLTYPYK